MMLEAFGLLRTGKVRRPDVGRHRPDVLGNHWHVGREEWLLSK